MFTFPFTMFSPSVIPHLLLHFDGTNGDTTTTDSSPNNFSTSIIASATISSAQSKFGGTSLSVPGSGACTVGTAADWKFLHDGSVDYTIEFFLRRNTLGVQAILTTAQTSTIGAGFNLYFTAANQLNLFIGRGVAGSTVLSIVTTSTFTSTTSWYYMASVYNASSNEMKLYVDGVLEGQATESNTPSTSNSTTTLEIGRAGANNTWLNGYVDELRIAQKILDVSSIPTAPFV